MVRRVVAALMLSGLLAGCTLGYVPLVPARHPFEPQLDLSRSPGLEQRGQRLYLTLTLTGVPDEGWLVVQWFLGNREVASESRWIAPAEEGERLVIPVPDDIELRPGRWRAVVSFQGQIARQFSLELREEIEDDADADDAEDGG